MNDFADTVGKGGRRMSTFGIAMIILGFLCGMIMVVVGSTVRAAAGALDTAEAR